MTAWCDLSNLRRLRKIKRVIAPAKKAVTTGTVEVEKAAKKKRRLSAKAQEKLNERIRNLIRLSKDYVCHLQTQIGPKNAERKDH